MQVVAVKLPPIHQLRGRLKRRLSRGANRPSEVGFSPEERDTKRRESEAALSPVPDYEAGFSTLDDTQPIPIYSE